MLTVPRPGLALNQRILNCLPLLLLGSLVTMLGCGRSSADVERYQVTRVKTKKEKSPAAAMPRESASAPQTMIGAIFLRGTKAWFFKVTAAPDVMEKRSEEVGKFLEGVRFGDDGNPKWEQPEGWQRLPGNQFRYATVRMGSAEDSPEIAVSSLEKQEGDDPAYLLANINRWRGQLQLSELKIDQLAKETTQRKAGDETFTYVEYTGKSGSGGGMGGPFAGKRPPMKAPPATAAGNSAGNDDGPKFKLPEGWKQIPPPSSFAKLAFRVEEGADKLEITISPLGGPAGGLVQNINRWRSQLKLEPQDEAGINASLKDIKCSGETGKYAELFAEESASPRNAILGSIVVKDGTSWFIKATGLATLAEREKTRFVEFVEQLELP